MRWRSVSKTPHLVARRATQQGRARLFGQFLNWTLAICKERGRVRSSPARSKEVIDAYPTDYDGTCAGTLCATVFRTRLDTCSATCDRCDPGSGKEDRSFRPKSSGPPRGEALLPLPSGLEPCCVVKPGGKPHPAWVARRSLCAQGTTGCGNQ